jgi:uncharacterized phage protein (TIGR02220 family)
MLNINEHIFDDLNQDEFWLIVQLARFGQNIFPSNDLILKRCSWGFTKLKAVKRSLVKRQFITVKRRFKIDDSGKSVRDSNEYVLKLETVTQYAGATQNDKHKRELTKALEDAQKEIKELNKEIDQLKKRVAELELENKKIEERKKPRKKRKTKADEIKERLEDIFEVLDFFKAVAGKGGIESKEQKEIWKNERVKKVFNAFEKGYSKNDCFCSIATKNKEWGSNEKMNKYLRPETLFADKHLFSYKDDFEQPNNPYNRDWSDWKNNLTEILNNIKQHEQRNTTANTQRTKNRPASSVFGSYSAGLQQTRNQ